MGESSTDSFTLQAQNSGEQSKPMIQKHICIYATADALAAAAASLMPAAIAQAITISVAVPCSSQ
jgi:hypothetical protein